MSATSEELAAHAEQLQTSVAFFRMETNGRPAQVHRAAAVTPPRRTAQIAGMPKIAKTTTKAAPAAAHNGKDRSRGGGFNLNLTSGSAGPRDAEFERM
jgi:methyl-accepting chemotaxis protein